MAKRKGFELKLREQIEEAYRLGAEAAIRHMRSLSLEEICHAVAMRKESKRCRPLTNAYRRGYVQAIEAGLFSSKGIGPPGRIEISG